MNSSTYRWIQLAVACLLMVVGVVIGTSLSPEGLGKFWQTVLFYEKDSDDETESDDSHDHGDAIEISETAIKNLDLKVGSCEIRDYQRTIQIPAKIVERLPAGHRIITAPIAGTVSELFIVPGQSIRPGDPLYELSATDDSVAEAQVKLINLISEIENANKHLNRIKPLAVQGSVKRSKVIEAELGLSQLKTRYDAACQELLLRGLSEPQLTALIENQTLVQGQTVYAPELPEADGSDPEKAWYTVEEINAVRGTNLERGASMCTLNYHGELFIEGYAYESDLEKLTIKDPKNVPISAQFGESDLSYTREGLELHSISNHVDPESQTFPIYVAISNEIQAQRIDDQQRTFVSWRFKPGQRVHLSFPVETWTDQYVVPIDAIAEEGPQVFVFLKYPSSHEHGNEIVHLFERVAVQLAYKDQDHAIITRDSQISEYATYALSDAQFLNLAFKQAASGGGGHGHSHPHPH